MSQRHVVLAGGLLTALAMVGSAQASSSVEREIQNLFWSITWFAFGVSAVVYGALVWFMIRYRQSASPRSTRHLTHHKTLEVVWSVVPAIILVLITAISMPVLLFTDTPPPAETVIEVRAFQWGWNFTYEDGTSTLGEVWFEEGRVVFFKVTSLDVIHSFAVEPLGIKIDAIPGRYNHFWVEADKPGEYLTQCAEFCGVGHYGMRAKVHVFAAGSQPKMYGPPPVPLRFTDVELLQSGGNPWSIRPANMTFPLAESRITLRVWNNNSVAYDFRVDPPINATVHMNPFDYAWMNFTVTSPPPGPVLYGPTNQAARDNGMVGNLTIQAGRVVTILLDNGGTEGHTWSISPPIDIESGETVTFELRNIGTLPHNFRMGGEYEEVYYEPQIPAGQSVFFGPFTFDTDAAGAFWCDIPGHRDSGMVSTYVVGEPTGGPAAALPLFELSLVTLAIACTASFAYLVHHATRRD